MMLVRNQGEDLVFWDRTLGHGRYRISPVFFEYIEKIRYDEWVTITLLLSPCSFLGLMKVLLDARLLHSYGTARSSPLPLRRREYSQHPNKLIWKAALPPAVPSRNWTYAIGEIEFATASQNQLPPSTQAWRHNPSTTRLTAQHTGQNSRRRPIGRR